MLAHDSIGYPETESYPGGFFRRDERLEDALQNFRRNSMSGIGKNDLHAVRPVLRPASSVLDSYTEYSAVWHSVQSVADNVSNYLANFITETGHDRSTFALCVHPDFFTRQSPSVERQYRVDDVADVCRGR